VGGSWIVEWGGKELDSGVGWEGEGWTGLG